MYSKSITYILQTIHKYKECFEKNMKSEKQYYLFVTRSVTLFWKQLTLPAMTLV